MAEGRTQCGREIHVTRKQHMTLSGRGVADLECTLLAVTVLQGWRQLGPLVVCGGGGSSESVGSKPSLEVTELAWVAV